MRIVMQLSVGLLIAMLSLPASAQTAASPRIGVVVMHGKGGSPARYVNELADGLAQKGYLVESLEMPWSGRRGYDLDVAAAEREVGAAFDALRGRGAQKLFIAGHSQGGVFALYYAGKHPPDGVIALAPGGSTASLVFQQQLGSSVQLARTMLAGGKGDERARFADYEGSRGLSEVTTTAATYLAWFDPDGAMDQEKSSRALPATLPVLYVAPRRDYPGLQRFKQAMYRALPANPLTRLYEPDSDHLGTPRAALDEVMRWTGEVAGR
jgi:pimeloyl-ACP methyl ester carboxylesterase